MLSLRILVTTCLHKGIEVHTTNHTASLHLCEFHIVSCEHLTIAVYLRIFVQATKMLSHLFSISTFTLLLLTKLATGLPHVEQHHIQTPIPDTLFPNPPLTYIPPIGLGLWQSKGKDATKAIGSAFNAGYRHLDGAAAYGNEDYVGMALNETLLPRSAYWLTSKLWNTEHHPSDVEPALRKTLSQLGTDYLDLYLMHWPVSQFPSNNSLDKRTSISATWHAMESLIRKGLTRHIGISNFSPAQLQQIIDHCLAGGVCPVAHEFETHPYLQQTEFVVLHKKVGIQVIAYSPLANLNPIYDSGLPSILEDVFWIKTAKSKNCTVAQAILGWGVQRGTVVIPKSVHEERIVENWGANEVHFTKEEMREIEKQDKKARFNNPSKLWGVKLFEGLDGV
jgi:alcohol dehydrogenase (NADP+)